MWFVVKKFPKESNDIVGATDDVLEDVCGPTMQDAELNLEFENETDDTSWHRDDIPSEQCLVSSAEEEEDDEHRDE